MANFDIAVGVGVNQVNSASIEIHRIAYPGPFRGSANVTLPVLNVPVTASWDVKEPLNVDFPPDLQDADLKVTLPFVEIGVVAATLPLTTLRFITDVAVDVSIDNGGKVSLLPKKVAVSSADLGTPLQSIIDDLLLPAALNVYGPSLPTIQLPPLQLQGVAASEPKAATQSEFLIGVTVLATKGPSGPPPAGSSWPAQDIFVLLSDDALNAAATVALAQVNPTLHDSGGDTFLGTGYEWHYDATISNFVVDVVGQSLQFTCSIDGTAGGGAVILFVPFDISYNVHVDAGATIGFTVDATNTVTAKTQSVTIGNVSLSPTGSIPSQLLGGLLDGIVNGIANSLKSTIASRLTGLTFTLFQVPNLPVTELGVSAIIRPHDLVITGFNGMLAITGTVEIEHP